MTAAHSVRAATGIFFLRHWTQPAIATPTPSSACFTEFSVDWPFLAINLLTLMPANTPLLSLPSFHSVPIYTNNRHNVDCVVGAMIDFIKRAKRMQSFTHSKNMGKRYRIARQGVVFDSRRISNRISAIPSEFTSEDESCISEEDRPDNTEEISSFPRVRVNSLGSRSLIEIVTFTDWCLLSSILVVLEDLNLEICLAHTLSVDGKVFYTILVENLETWDIDVGCLRSKLCFVAADNSGAKDLDP